jgi:hypothetical protein
MRTRSGGIVLLILAFFLAGSVHARGPWRASEGNTSGWQFMTPEERIEHQARIRSFRNYEDCVAYRRQHHQQMAERARAQGETLRPGRRDVCAHLLPPDAAR